MTKRYVSVRVAISAFCFVVFSTLLCGVAEAFTFTTVLPCDLVPLEPAEIKALTQASVYTDSNGTDLPYRIYIPENYSSEVEYPLVIYFHDDVFNGDDNADQLSGITPMSYLLTEEYRNAYEPIVIIPQCAQGDKWVNVDTAKGNYLLDNTPVSKHMNAVFELVSSLASSYNFDMDGQVIFGDGAGGTAAWDYAMRNIENIFFLAPSGGVGDITKAYMFETAYVWMFHGKSDETVPFIYAKELYDAIAATFPENFLGTFYDGGHDVSKKKYAEDEIYYMAFSNVLYQKTEYNIDISYGEHGKIIGETTVKYARAAEFLILPDEGYTVDKLYVDGVEIPTSEIKNGTYTFGYVREDHILHVTFKEAEITETIVESASSVSKYIVIGAAAVVVAAIVVLIVSDARGKGKKDNGKRV